MYFSYWPTIQRIGCNLTDLPTIHKFGSIRYLIIVSVSLALGIQSSAPVVGLEIELVVDINLNFKVSLALADWVNGNTRRGEGASNESANASWAPVNYFTSLQVEFGSQNRVLDGAVGIDFSETKGLVHGRALVTKSIHSSL